MGYKSELTLNDDEWSDQSTVDIYVAYARKALGEPTDAKENYWSETSTKALDFWSSEDYDSEQVEQSLADFEDFAETAAEDMDDFELWMKLYY